MKTEATFQFGDFRVDPLDRTLRRDDVPIALNRRAFDVLLYLVQNPGRVVTKDELLKNVWADAFVDENNLTQSISTLRRALEDRAAVPRPDRPAETTYIRTLPGRGYQFIVPVHVIEPPAALVLDAPTQPSAMLLQQRTITTRTVTEEHNQQRRPTRTGLYVPALLILAAAGVGAYAAWRHLHPAPTSATVVVANFLNTTGDATFDRTLDRALEIDLSQSPYMDVMSDREVIDSLQYMGLKSDAALTADVARQVCIRGNREAVLTGSIAGIGNRYLLTLEATGCNTGKQLAAAKAEASSKEAVLAAVDSLADRVRSKLGESAKSLESYQVPTAQATTASLDALKAYSMGDYLSAHDKDENESLIFFQKAAELDPQFAMAYGEIATQYYNLGEYDKATVYYARAFQLREHVNAREKLLLEAHYYGEGQNDIENGIKTYKVWAATYPNDWAPAVNLCNEYNGLGQYDLAIEAGRHALQQQPDRGVVYSVLARALMHANRFEEAKAVGAQAVKRGKDSAGLHGSLFNIASFQQDAAALNREFQWAAAHTEGWYGWYFNYSQASADAALGKYQQAAPLYLAAYRTAQNEKASQSADGVLTDQAQVELNFGLTAAARATLARVADRDSDVPDLAILSAELGDPTLAQHFLARFGKQTVGTEMVYSSLPRVRAALALQENKPLDAIAALETSRPYQLAGYSVLTLRGQAYLQARNPAQAAAQFNIILANPGIEPAVSTYALAHLGLARAYAMAGDIPSSRSEYTAFLTLWKDADPNLPVLRDARAERGRL